MRGLLTVSGLLKSARGLLSGGVAGLSLALAAVVLPVPAGAQTLFTPPDGCQVFLTVQSRSCKVSHHYTCKGDPAGDQWRVDYDLKGPLFLGRINAETEWLLSASLVNGAELSLLPGAPDPASFTALTETGVDTYDFSIGGAGDLLRYQGSDRLTGRKPVIDGVELEETAFEFRETNAAGSLLGEARGHQYISRKHRLFFAGPSSWESEGVTEPSDHSPVRFDEPGDAGFRSVTPEYDCLDQLAALQ